MPAEFWRTFSLSIPGLPYILPGMILSFFLNKVGHAENLGSLFVREPMRYVRFVSEAIHTWVCESVENFMEHGKREEKFEGLVEPDKSLCEKNAILSICPSKSLPLV